MAYSWIKSFKIPGPWGRGRVDKANRVDEPESGGWEDWDELDLADKYKRLERMARNGNHIGGHRAGFIMRLREVERDLQELEEYRNGVAGNRRREAVAATKLKQSGDDSCHFGD